MSHYHRIKFQHLKRPVAYFYAVSMIICFFIPNSWSQGCDPSIKPSKNPQTGYQWRGNRCEGFFISNISGGDIQVINVTIGVLTYQLDKKEQIIIDCPNISSLINIRAVSVPLRLFYRMDAKIDKTVKQMQWDVKNVIYKAKLDANKIGLFGWIQKDGEFFYVPVRAASKLSQSANAAQDNAVRLYWRASVDVENVHWKYADIKTGKWSSWISVTKSRFIAGELIKIKLPLAITGKINLEVAAQVIDNGSNLIVDGKPQWLKENIKIDVVCQ